MVRPHGEGLVLDQLRYADEVRSFDEVPIEPAEVKPAESHFNLARLCEARGNVSAALRHLAAYKRIHGRGVG